MNKKLLKIFLSVMIFALISVFFFTGCFSKAVQKAAESIVAESLAAEQSGAVPDTTAQVEETTAVPVETAAQYQLTGKDLVILTQPAVCFVVTYYSAYVYDPQQNDYYGPYYSNIYYGTGFCINPGTGHIMTAGHVVDIPEVDVKWKILDDHVWEVYGADAYYDLTDADWTWIYNNYKVVGETSDTYMDREVWVQFNTATSGLADSSNAQYMRAEIIDSSPWEQRDIAIIRIQSITGGALSSVLLSDSSMMEVQDDITIIGYPYTSDIGQDNPMNPTVTTGRVSGKMIWGGTEVLQVQGDARQGNSGGPVLNSNGMVIGMLTMGTDDTNNFLRPSSDLKVMINKNGIENTLGMVDEEFKKGLINYRMG
ncbi:MAG: trypsin-like peptidase domain-containing protein, partial [Actinobacteria bacterium]|nr:trypsin-like peptidase domain-containing protein [Actinomycetota bacterium]